MRPSLILSVPKVRYRMQTPESRILDILNPVNYRNAKGGKITGKSLRGVYHGTMMIKGNNVNRKDKNFIHRSLRFFRPNVQDKILYSETLDAKFRMPTTAKASRKIADWGGFDNYLLNTNPTYLSRETCRIRDKVREVLHSHLDSLPEGAKILPRGITPGVHFQDRVRPVEFVEGDKVLKKANEQKYAEPAARKRGWRGYTNPLEMVSGLAKGKKILGLEDFRRDV
ncbi:Mitochondrial/chloroplast ribosomal protein L28 [Phaffia rhodozyma]|uniref:Mitochondrial/chloroplast ribosomal protein L28 n=1 Tax=Phaffia rhodozyma TaxID=264483 RepID=A0A0F7SUM2_PHARH|nr:Mitochondrial/chloroplast ribosomal protein L28 [Phaffia rhodozyma]